MNERRAVAAMLALVVLAASLAPLPGGLAGGPAGQAGGTTGFGVDKLLHVVGYAALTCAVAGAVRAQTPRRLGAARRLTAVVLAVTAFGAGIELVQPLVGRTASLLDALANLAGAVAGALLRAFSRSRLSA